MRLSRIPLASRPIPSLSRVIATRHPTHSQVRFQFTVRTIESNGSIQNGIRLPLKFTSITTTCKHTIYNIQRAIKKTERQTDCHHRSRVGLYIYECTYWCMYVYDESHTSHGMYDIRQLGVAQRQSTLTGTAGEGVWGKRSERGWVGG